METILPRMNITEIEDRESVPRLVRHYTVENVRILMRLFRLYRGVPEAFAAFLAKARPARVVDLASGSGGPVETMIEGLARLGAESPRFTLTDRYPFVQAFQEVARRHPGIVDFEAEPRDAWNFEGIGKGAAITVFDAIHHLSEDDLGRVIAAATRAACGLFLFESNNRRVYQVPRAAAGCLIASALSPLVSRPFRWSRMLLAWPLPITPLATVHDGVVSTLKRFTEMEICGIIARHADPSFQWSIERLQGGAVVVCGWRGEAPQRSAPSRGAPE